MASIKKKTSYTMSIEVDALLTKLAISDSRSKSQMLEVLIKNAASKLVA